jgi:hypothetical protein
MLDCAMSLNIDNLIDLNAIMATVFWLGDGLQAGPAGLS